MFIYIGKKSQYSVVVNYLSIKCIDVHCYLLSITGFRLHIEICIIQEPIRRISTTSPADPTAPFFKPGGGPMAPLAKLVIQVNNVHRSTRETREGWALLTVETEANGDSKSTNERGPSRRYKRFLSCLGCFSRPSTKPFFLTVYFD
jgi:hypothetical protein